VPGSPAAAGITDGAGASLVVSDRYSRLREAPDQELVEQARAGNRGAFCALMHRHQAGLLRLVGRFLASREDAEDVLQDTFVAAYRQMDRFRGEAAVGTWLGRIALYTAMRVSRRQRLTASDDPDPEAWGVEETDRAEALAVREAVGRLPEKLRLPVVLRFWEGMSGREMAAMLGWRQSTVWTRLYRGMERLRKDLQGVEAG